MQIDKSTVLGLITVNGSVNFDTAILAGMLNMSALVGGSIEWENRRWDD